MWESQARKDHGDVSLTGAGRGDDVMETVRKLRAELERYDRRRARRAGWTLRFIPTGLAPLDAVLPHGGLPRGAVIEILSNGLGLGAMSLAVRIAAQFYRASAPAPLLAKEGLGEVNAHDESPSGDVHVPAHLEKGEGWPMSSDVGRRVDHVFRSEASKRTCPLSSPFLQRFSFSHSGSNGALSPSENEESRGLKPAARESRRLKPAAREARGLKPAARNIGTGNALERWSAQPISKEMGRPFKEVERSSGCSEEHRGIILFDTHGDFYPPAAWQRGIAPERLIVIRTKDMRDAFWAVDQSLRCAGVAAVIAPFDRLDERCSRRLQLAAESSGCVGLLLKSSDRRVKSFAAVRMLVEGVGGEDPARPSDDCYPCRITLLAVREGMPTEPILVDLHHETGVGPLHSVPVDRPAAKIA